MVPGVAEQKFLGMEGNMCVWRVGSRRGDEPRA